MPVDNRQVLDAVRGRLTELRRERTQVSDRVREAKEYLSKVNTAGKVGDITASDEFRRAETALREQDEVGRKITLAEEEERFHLGRIAGVDGSGHGRETFLNDPDVLSE